VHLTLTTTFFFLSSLFFFGIFTLSFNLRAAKLFFWGKKRLLEMKHFGKR